MKRLIAAVVIVILAAPAVCASGAAVAAQKGMVKRVFYVYDMETGKAVAGAIVSAQWEDIVWSPETTRRQGSATLTFPANIQVYITISANGYELDTRLMEVGDQRVDHTFVYLTPQGD